MGIHIQAEAGQIAETVLLPGDPLRAKYLADHYLDNAVCYNDIRGMLGYTGYFKGQRVSVQGTGMGIPSIAIYATELMNFYGCQNLIRIGTCGAIQPYLKLGDVVLAITASTDSNFNRVLFRNMEFAPSANFGLLKKAYDASVNLGLETHVGPVFTTDAFFVDDFMGEYAIWQKYGILAVEMETTALYSIAAKYGRKALSLLTVSDQLITEERCTAEERLTSFTNMMEIALAAVKAL